MAKYRGREVKLNKIMRSQRKDKKYKVYVKDGSKVKAVHFGDPNMRIKRNDPDRRKSFLARHKPTSDKTTPRYWARKSWDPKTELP